MAAESPQDVDRLFVKAMNAQDLEAVMSLYLPETVFVREPGQTVGRGLDELRAISAGFASLSPRLEVEPRQFVQADDIALVSVRWHLTGTGPDGRAVAFSGTDANVVRRLPDGTWRTLIDNPFHDQHVGLVTPARSE